MRISDWSSDVCSSDLLVPGGWLLLEHGWTQGDAVRALLADAGFVAVSTALDLEQRERVSMGRSEEHTSELPSIMRISYADFCLQKKNIIHFNTSITIYLPFSYYYKS